MVRVQRGGETGEPRVVSYLKATDLLNLLPAKKPFSQARGQLREGFLGFQNLVVYFVQGGAVCNVQGPKDCASLLFNFFCLVLSDG